MAGYTPGEQLNASDIVKLNTNENPYPPSPMVFEAVRAALTGDCLRKYPQPLGDTFRKAAARVLNVDPDGILIGNGSDDILTIITRAMVPEGGTIASPTPSYVLYKSLAEIQNAEYVTVPFTDSWTLPNPWPVKKANLTFLANPNSPSGTMLPQGDLVRLADAGPLVLDEAYGDFSEWNGLEFARKRENVIVTRSFSKYYALAGIRFGFAVAKPALVRELVKVKDSYNCDVLSLAAATAAIEDQVGVGHLMPAGVVHASAAERRQHLPAIRETAGPPAIPLVALDGVQPLALLHFADQVSERLHQSLSCLRT